MNFKVGQKVLIKMNDHLYKGEIGTIEMALSNPNLIPGAILVAMQDGFKDWFFGIPENLEIVEDGAWTRT